MSISCVSELGSNADGQPRQRQGVSQDIAALEQQLRTSIRVSQNCAVSPLEEFSYHQRESRSVWTVVQRYLFGLQGCSEKSTVEPDESRRGVKYFGPGDRITPTLPNVGKRRHSLKVGHLLRTATGHGVPVRKPLVAFVFTDGQKPQRLIHS